MFVHPQSESFEPQTARPGFRICKPKLTCQPNRKRNRSELSTESQESASHKLVKTSEELGGESRVQGNSLSSRPRRSTQKKSPSPKRFNKRTSYNTKRLDLGPSIDSVRQQQELKSRLKAMVYCEKVLTEDKAIVVPCLPSFLSLSDP